MKLLNKYISIYEYIKLMGFKWFIFRLKYEFLKKINYFDIVNKKIIKTVEQSNDNIYFYNPIGIIKNNFQGDESFIEKADNAIKGKIFAFSNHYLDYLKDGKINWQMNPITKVEANRNLSWNHLADFAEYGDIKLIWEASRFPQVYYFIHAFSVTKNKRYANACIKQIIDWINDNPYPYGVNYKCGQEITFRILSWIMALEYFKDFISKTEEKIIVKNIYLSILRVNANINYAIKSVKNNHSISEASGLFIIGLLFPQFKESKQMLKKGLKYILHETSYQIYNDGSYIQHSFTYQRLVLDILSFIFLISRKKNFTLPNKLINRHFKMIFFLNSFMQKNGWLPNYGTNDGTNLFLVDSNDYRDFRTSLNFALGKSVFFDIEGNNKLLPNKKVNFLIGGYYILKNKDIFTFIRCHSYKHRPAQNDMFHLDIWYKNKNIFCDTGSYSYNTDKDFKDNFIGAKGHNTIIVNNSNHMEQVLNFGYSNWTKAKCLYFDNKHFIGENHAYLNKFGIIHNREVKIYEHKIIVIDNIKNIDKQTNIKQVWNTKENVKIIDNFTLQVNNCIVSSNIKYRIEKSYISDYYNNYITGTKIIFETNIKNDTKIKTEFCFLD